MAAILLMQIRWSLFIYELFEPLAALEMFAFFRDDVFMYNQSTLLITSLLSQSHFKKEKKNLIYSLKLICILISILNINYIRKYYLILIWP